MPVADKLISVDFAALNRDLHEGHTNATFRRCRAVIKEAVGFGICVRANDENEGAK